MPENCNKFVDVAVGESYILCLIEDNEENINNSKEKEKENESIGESLKENEKATVTIKVKIKFESGIWEKEYNVYTILKQIDFEFKIIFEKF